MKRVINFTFILILCFTLCGCGNKEKTDAVKFKEEYESLNNKTNESNSKKYREVLINKDNPIKYKTADEIATMIDEKESFIVYFGFDTCPWCRSVVPTMLEVAKDLGIETIYYVDVKEIRDTLKVKDGKIITEKDGSKGYYKLLELLDEVLEDYTLDDDINTNEKRIYAPSVISVVDGKAKELETGVSDKQTDGYMELTEVMKKETYEKFKCSMKCVIESSTTCSNKNSC